MRQNYRGNKKRIEETKRKRKEEKRIKRIAKNADPLAPVESGAAPEITPETTS